MEENRTPLEMNNEDVYSEHRRSLLVVEDNALNREIVAALLGEEYEIIFATNGKEGIAALLLQSDDISAILLDLEMPVMNGYEFMETVQKDETWKKIPIIVTTSNDSAKEEERCLMLGASDFIRKPYQRSLALARIRNVIRMTEASMTLRVLERDELTGIFTKRAFLHRAQQIVEQNTERDFGILVIDIENFKLMNDQYGESKCDELLAYLGSRIDELSAGDVTGRYGGDQFIILYELRDRSDRSHGFEKTDFQKMIIRNAPIPNVTLKLGAYVPIDRDLPLARCCDRALLAVREIKGSYDKSFTYYESWMGQQVLDEQRIQINMEKSLEDEQFQVFYQPKHDSMTGNIAGAEALVRWIHPDLGFISPGRFIPIFEKNGFITKLDAYVMSCVCRDIARWKNQGLSVVPVSVNVSRRDYLEEGWVDAIIQMIDNYGIDHSLIHMEVTESMYAEHTERIIEQIRKLRSHGFAIEMDDFGAGYSSLGMLATFPLDIIKLDISFVRQIQTNEIVIENVIHLAHRMGYTTVAEGAETEGEFRILRSLGCDFIQGFYFSKPLAVADFEMYLMEKDCEEINRLENNNITQKWSEITGQLEIKNALLSCIEVLSYSEDNENRMNKLLTLIGAFYGAERVQIYELEDTFATVVANWCKDDKLCPPEEVRRVPIEYLKSFLAAFGRKPEIFLPTRENIRYSDPLFFEMMVKNDIRNMMAAPLRKNGVITGFVIIDNPTMHTDTLELVKSLSSFIVNEFERTQYLEDLLYVSYRDPLTGFRNRRAYYDDVENITGDEELSKIPVGIVYVDVNGLKMMNDNSGHDAGDQMILKIAHILSYVFRDSHLYRLGGDEFIVLNFGIDKDGFDDEIRHLNECWDEETSAAVGYVWVDNSADIEKSVTLADQRMYLDKNKYYKKKINNKRQVMEGMQNKELAQGFAAMYNSIYIVNLDARQMSVFAANNDISQQVLSEHTEFRDYYKMMDTFVENYVSEADQMRFKRNTDLSHVRDKLTKKNFYSFTIHRRNTENTMEHVEVLFLRMGPSERIDRAIMAYRTLA